MKTLRWLLILCWILAAGSVPGQGNTVVLATLNCYWFFNGGEGKGALL